MNKNVVDSIYGAFVMSQFPIRENCGVDRYRGWAKVILSVSG